MTRVFQGQGLVCTYPENWQLTEDTEEQAAVGFTLQSPNTAFMTVYRYPPEIAPSQAIEETKRVIAAEYDDIESQVVEPEIAGASPVISELQGQELSFYYLDLLVFIRLIAFRYRNETLLIHCQAEDREFAKLDLVFQAMMISMFASAKPTVEPR